jgi:hypothetical protein
MIHFKN